MSKTPFLDRRPIRRRDAPVPSYQTKIEWQYIFFSNVNTHLDQILIKGCLRLTVAEQ
jgi:hypothetical protein